MTTGSYRASKTRSNNRPGWSVTFSHPLRKDNRGKPGLKVRRGLGTADPDEAQRLVDQLNELLSDQSWWSLDRLGDAGRHFNTNVVAAFFDEIEIGKIEPRHLREEVMPLPNPEQGYARIMLVGSTGAGKTTLLRQLIGSDHKQDRFPSTSTAKTTTSEIEIVSDPGADFYDAVITFKPEHEVRCAVEECLEDACVAVIRGQDDAGVASALLEHREQRFRLSYVLGGWQQAEPHGSLTSLFGDDETDDEALPDEETVLGEELSINNRRLVRYVGLIRKITELTSDQLVSEHGPYEANTNIYRRQEWLDTFTDQLYENETFTELSFEIMDVIRSRSDNIAAGKFELTSTGWPRRWQYRKPQAERAEFLRQIRWFTGNHGDQFGKLLTPLVDGIRAKGPFVPAAAELRDPERKLVFLDGEGLGHSAREANSVSTKVTERFRDVDMILLVDSAESPMQAAPLELLRSAGSSGHGRKIAVAFTHFDQVKGDNLRTDEQKLNHVHASIGNAVLGLRDSLGAPVAAVLEGQLQEGNFYLGGLDKPANRISRGFVDQLRALLNRMQESSELTEEVAAAPIYSISRLELVLRDATDGFKNPWKGRLGLSHEGPREHWARVKALCRRIANWWDNEYSGLRPVADLVRELQVCISLWLNNPAGWTSYPQDDKERETAISNISQHVFDQIHRLAERRLIANQRTGWQAAFGFSGRGSSRDRAVRMVRIYDEAAPSISSAMDVDNQEFLDEVIQIVRVAVEENGGAIEGMKDRDAIGVA
ncbi:MAG: hypothetical protein OXE17_06790 [Chloroflexi bacterium]|nr:hypothetical protein [Chloroflexota bacterium]